MKVFISWSGTKSNRVALTFKDWLPNIFNVSKDDIFVSSEDIEKGSNWNAELVKELENNNFGILCITKENIVAPWIMFEAGAISKFREEARVCPFLLDLTKDDVKSNPLSQFQITEFDKDDILKLLKSINKKCNQNLSEQQIKNSFNGCYKELKKELDKIIKDYKAPKTPVYTFEELKKNALEIEEGLKIIRANSLDIFHNQSQAVADFRENHSHIDVSLVKILCIRGQSFVSVEHKENWGSIIPTKSKKIVVLGNYSNDELIMNRCTANKQKDETENDVLKRYREEMQYIQNRIKNWSDCSLYLHNETALTFRMIFIGDCLYLSKFAETTASQAAVIKIKNDSTLYAVCEQYYDKVKSNAELQE